MLNTLINDEIKAKLNDINFPVAVMEIPTIPKSMALQVKRTDTNTVLGICKSRYKPIKHLDAFGGAIANMIKGGVDFTDADIQVDSYEFGAMAKMEIVLPKHKTQVGDHNLKLKYIARNSYNGRWKFQSFFGWLNEVCFNTLVSGRQLAYTANRHTTHFDIEASNEKIFNAVKLAKDDAKNYNEWWYTKVNDDQVADMFKSTICKKDTNLQKYVKEDVETNKKQLGVLMDLYDKEVTQIHGKGKGSLWCAFQSATYWSTLTKDHVRELNLKESSKLHIVEQKRQDAVKSMLNSKQWKELETA